MEKKVKPAPDDAPAFLIYACAQLCGNIGLKVTVELEDEYIRSEDIKKKKSVTNIKRNYSTTYSEHELTSLRVVEEESSNDDDEGDDVVRVHCVLAGPRTLVAIRLDRSPAVPRKLLKVLHLCAPYNPHFTRFSARRTTLEPAVPQELAQLLLLCNISDVCLDDTPTFAADCLPLLDTGRLRRLSLARCQLGDEGCAAVAEALAFPRPASRSLVVLSLACNAIGDAGAIALANALRSNRTLRMLDLADNRLQDEGAIAILRTLNEFTLTVEEILAGRRLRLDYGRRHAEMLLRYLLAMRETDEARERRRLRRAPHIALHAYNPEDETRETAAARELGPLQDPFSAEETVERGGLLHSRGNTVLNSLNLAYNALTVLSVRALLGVLQGQAEAGCTGGLVRVLLDGNPLPSRLAEYEAASALMERTLSVLVAATGKKHQQQQVKKKIYMKK